MHTPESVMDARALTWAAELRSHGRRVTRQRLGVLNAVDQLPHADAEAILGLLRGTFPDITIQSVYVVLGDLTELGMLRRIEPPESPARYETRVDDNHHHAVCTGCGRIEDVDCAVGHAPCLTPSETHGMTIRVAEVIYRGLCSNCDTTRIPAITPEKGQDS